MSESHVLEERGSHLIPPPVDNSQSRLLQPNRVGNVGDQKDLENILNVDTLHHVFFDQALQPVQIVRVRKLQQVSVCRAVYDADIRVQENHQCDEWSKSVRPVDHVVNALCLPESRSEARR